MNLTPVMYTLEVGGNYFLKSIFVQFLPTDGSNLKIVNHSFRVNEIEQDLDAYADEHHLHGSSCESVRAKLDPKAHNKADYPEVEKALLENGWSKAAK